MSAPIRSVLEDFGLRRHEPDVYLALLELGPSPAGTVARRCKLHRQLVYLALESLEERGLVSHRVVTDTKIFSAESPEVIFQQESERYRRIKAALPEMLELQPKGSAQVQVQVHTRPDDIVGAILSTLDSAARGDGIVRIIGGATGRHIYNVLGDRYKEYTDHARALRVRKRLLVPESPLGEYRQKFLREWGTSMRFVPQGLSSPAFTRVTHEMVVFIIFAEQPAVVELINRTVAKAYREHFDLLWKTATPVEGE